MLPCSDVKVRLNHEELLPFDFFISGRQDQSSLTDSDSSDQENYTCPCGKTFKKKAAYQRHLDISHSDTVSYPCGICGKTFGKLCTLTMHMSIHGIIDNKKAFETMERPSTRSQVKSIGNLSSPLRENKTDSKKHKIIAEKVVNSSDAKTKTSKRSSIDSINVNRTSKYATRSTSKESSVQSSPLTPQRDKVGVVVPSPNKIRTRSSVSSQLTADKNSLLKSQHRAKALALEKKVSKLLERKKNGKTLTKVAEVKVTDNNNLSIKDPGKDAKKPSDLLTESNNNDVIIDSNKLSEGIDSVTAASSSSSTNSQTTESDKENNDILEQLSPKTTETSLTSTVTNIVTNKIIQQIVKPSEKFQVIKLPSELKKDDSFVVHHTNNNSNITSTHKQSPDVGNTVILPERNKVYVNTVGRRDSGEAKPASKTIVIVIREAKRIPNTDNKNTTILALNKNREMLPTQQVSPEIAIASTNGNLQTKKVTIVENNNVVPKTVSNITNKIKTIAISANQMSSVNHNGSNTNTTASSIEKADSVEDHTRKLSNLKIDSVSGETTESDNGNDDQSTQQQNRRKNSNARKRKKNAPTGVIEGIIDGKIQQKKQQGDDSEDKKLNDVAQELFGSVSAEMIADEEIQDVSSQIFRQQKSLCNDYVCIICGLTFATEKYLQMHIPTHGATVPASDLIAENYKVNEVKDANGNGSSWRCRICKKMFAQNSSFKNHMRTHSDERPFLCHKCSIGFKEKYHLRKHIKFVHEKEMTEECKVCGKKFKDSTAVRAHERIHSNLRPYKCRNCNKAFKTSECLWHHENRSKSCGGKGGPPRPPLRKRGRISRKNANMQENLQAENGSTTFDLFEEMIKDEAATTQQQNVSTQAVSVPAQAVIDKNLLLQQENNTSFAFMTPPKSTFNFTQSVPMANNTNVLTQSQSSYGQPSTLSQQPQQSMVFSNAISKPTPQTGVQTQPMHTVKVNQGQPIVFSVPVLKDCNVDPAAQVTKAILDAISNTTGNMKGGINIQKTIQCAVNNVQGGFDPVKPMELGTTNVVAGQSQATPAETVNVSNAVLNNNQNTVLPVQQQLQKIMHQSNNTPPIMSVSHQHGQPQVQIQPKTTTYFVPQIKKEPETVNVNHCSVTTAPQQQILQVTQPNIHYTQPSKTITPPLQLPVFQQQQQAVATSKPYLVSILPPIESVAKALKTEMKQEEDEEIMAGLMEDTSSTDSGDEEGDMPLEVKNFVLQGTRPVATVRPLQRNEGELNSSQSQVGIIESTNEPYIVKHARGKQSKYICGKCHKGFASFVAFQKHLRKHNLIRPFRCDTCDMGFKLKVHLNKHNLYVHSDEYPCECSICGKKFKDSSAVRLHERIHSDARPFQCGCGKSFKTKENLWGHQNRKMCPYAGYPPPQSSSDTTQYYQENSPVQAHSKLEDAGTNASVKPLPNKVIAEAIVSNVNTQIMVGQNGQATTYTGVIPKSEPLSSVPIKTEQTKTYLYPSANVAANNTIPVNKAILKTENGEIHCTVSLPSKSHSPLPSFETFASSVKASASRTPSPSQPTTDDLQGIRFAPAVKAQPASRTPSPLQQLQVITGGVNHTIPVAGNQIRKKSIAEQCPTIQGLLQRGPQKLPSIQQIMPSRHKPPPPYPGHVTPPTVCLSDSSFSGSLGSNSASPISSPTQIITTHPFSTSYSRQNSQSPIAANLNVSLNPDQLYGTGASRDPFISKCETGSNQQSPMSETSPSTFGMMIPPRSPRGIMSSHAVSPAPSGCGDNSMPPVIFNDDNKPVVPQWHQMDSDTLFHELSQTVLDNNL